MPYKDKEAQREYHQRYYHKNKERIKRNSKKPERLEKRKAYLKVYNEENKLLIAATQAKCYKRKKDAYKERIKKRLREHAVLVAVIKMHYGCMNNECGWRADYDSAMLDFHHQNPNEKAGKITQMLGGSKRRLAKEINKCVVLCANCHRLTHTQRAIIVESHCAVDDQLLVCE